MRLKVEGILLAVSCIISVSYAQDTAQTEFKCSEGPWSKIQIPDLPHYLLSTMGDPNSTFCETGWEKGLQILGIDAWAEGPIVRGIQFTYSDGNKSVVRGLDTGDHQSISWGVADTITAFEFIAAGTDAEHIGKSLLHFETSNGQKLDMGGQSDPNSDAIQINFAYDPSLGALPPGNTGILIGAVGTSRDRLTGLAMLYMDSKAGKASVTSVKFPEDIKEWNSQQKGIKTVSLSEVTFDNTGADASKTYTFANEKDETTSKTMQQDITTAFGQTVDVDVSAGIQVPYFSASVDVNTENTYNYSNMTSDKGTEESTTKLQWQLSGTMKPGQAVVCKATAMTGVFDSDYTSTVTVTMANGKTFSITQPGNFKSVGWSEATADCEDVASNSTSSTDIPTSGEGNSTSSDTSATSTDGASPTSLRSDGSSTQTDSGSEGSPTQTDTGSEGGPTQTDTSDPTQTDSGDSSSAQITVSGSVSLGDIPDKSDFNPSSTASAATSSKPETTSSPMTTNTKTLQSSSSETTPARTTQASGSSTLASQSKDPNSSTSSGPKSTEHPTTTKETKETASTPKESSAHTTPPPKKTSSKLATEPKTSAKGKGGKAEVAPMSDMMSFIGDDGGSASTSSVDADSTNTPMRAIKFRG